ncbi:MAG: type II toxin-antitoxin system PemK/MazF family toxin [Thermodesulfobacteriota bacterium]|nr:type II toxin-antitoxin system PemK/MazF family toxin [Thermodesulfobacteriota bacterium]
MIIKQGEVWLVKFFPKVGSEISKMRPAVVVSHNGIGRLPLKTIVPVTGWKTNYAHYPWMIQVAGNSMNGLTKVSAVDCFQIKNFSDARFMEKSGEVNSETMKQIHATIVKCLDPDYNIS